MASPGRKKPTEEAKLPPEATRVLRRFRVLFNAVRRHFRATETRVGLSGAQVWALGVIGGHPGIGVNELAEAMDVHQSTASNLLRTLTSHELVQAERDAADKRAVRLKATARGRKVLKDAPGPYAGVLPEALLALDPRTLNRLDRDLAALIALVSPDEDGAQVLMGHERR